MGHVLLALVALVAHQCTLVKGGSLSAKGSIQVFDLPALRLLISPDKSALSRLAARSYLAIRHILTILDRCSSIV